MLMKGLIKVMSDDLFTENLMMRLWWMEKSRTYRMTERVLGQVEQSKALTLRWGHGGWKDKNLPVNRKADGEVRVSRRKKIGVEKKIKTMSSGNSFHVLMWRHWIHGNPTHPGGVNGKKQKDIRMNSWCEDTGFTAIRRTLAESKENKQKDMRMNSWCEDTGFTAIRRTLAEAKKNKQKTTWKWTVDAQMENPLRSTQRILEYGTKTQRSINLVKNYKSLSPWHKTM